jgi:hypothetical protein
LKDKATQNMGPNKGKVVFKENLCLPVFTGSTVLQPGATQRTIMKKKENYIPDRFSGMCATVKAGCSRILFQTFIDV